MHEYATGYSDLLGLQNTRRALHAPQLWLTAKLPPILPEKNYPVPPGNRGICTWKTGDSRRRP